MKYIANILTEKSFSDSELYNIVNDKSQLIDGIPTLVVGWSLTKKLYPTANIINWQIDQNTYWTFGFREKRNRLEDCTKRFRELAMDRLIKSVEYKFFNIIIAEKDDKISFCNMLTNENTAWYVSNDVLYLNEKNSSVVYGLSLRDIEYLGKDKKKIYQKLSTTFDTNPIVSLYTNVSAETKISLRNHIYIVPYLFS